MSCVPMPAPRTVVRVTLVSTEALGATARVWRERIEREVAGVNVVHLESDALLHADGTAMHVDAEVAIVFAGEEPVSAQKALDRTLHSVERAANDAYSIASARVLAVSDLLALTPPRSTSDVMPLARVESDLVPYLRGVLACASNLREARRELSLLGRVVDSMRSELEERSEELQLAALVQRDFLPLPVPAVHGVRVATFYRPLAGVSGDVYHVEQLDEDRVSIFLADAVGHGIPAALLGMAICRSLETIDRTNGDARLLGPSETLSRANRRLVEHQRATTRFATAIAGVLDCRTRRLRLAIAGHPPAILLRPGCAPEQIACEGGLLGIFPDEPYEEIELELRPNDRLLFYSDGFEQAFTEDGASRHVEEFGLLSGVLDADQLVQEIASRIDQQSGSLHQADDLTLLCISVEEISSLRLAA